MTKDIDPKTKNDYFDWAQIATRVKFSIDGVPILSDSTLPAGHPEVENQISAPEEPWAISFFKQFHLPMIYESGIKPDKARILEIGGGLGWLSYGTLGAITPEIYVATDVFPELIATLASNLKKWTTVETAAAFLDPQDSIYIKSNFFNVIQSHSVLHHVLDYRSAVKALFERLASPGVILFCEPCLEGHLFFLSIIRMFSKIEKIPIKMAKQVSDFETYILQRTGAQRNNMDFLRQFGTGDKYLYSAYDLFELAESMGARLSVKKDGRSLKESYKFEFKLRGADENILKRFDDFLQSCLPEGIENAYFSDMRQIFALHKS